MLSYVENIFNFFFNGNQISKFNLVFHCLNRNDMWTLHDCSYFTHYTRKVLHRATLPYHIAAYCCSFLLFMLQTTHPSIEINEHRFLMEIDHHVL